MKRKGQIEALLQKASEQFSKISLEYNRSLSDQRISDSLKIDIKNMCENLRSVLDYIAHEIKEKVCSISKNDRFYFPILPDKSQFTRKTLEWFPELDKTNLPLFIYLESIQPYNTDNEWLGMFNKINNENKHGSLVEQTKNEKTVRITASHTTNGSSVSWDPSSVRFGNGVYINGVPVNPLTQMPLPSPTQTITKTIWVDFIFDGVNISALELLKTSLVRIEKIYKEISNLL